jgi:hypothetical protein
VVPGAAGAAFAAEGFAAGVPADAEVSAGLGELLHEANASAAVPAKAITLNFLVEVTEKDAPDGS